MTIGVDTESITLPSGYSTFDKKDWVTILSKMYEYAIQENGMRRSDCLMVNYRLPGKNEKPDEKSVKPFEAEEVALLLESATGDLLNYLGIGFYSGMRPEETIALMISDQDDYAKYLGKSHLRLDRDMDIFTKRKTGDLTGSRKVE